ncbi:MAG: tetratricopeptide repeat protein [Clostridium sp.]|uniref:tetratricopeptide repeat protein n=1 Tax=Clostridium sp. TaxID=1506 RepID=UPI003D6CBFAC
MDKSGKEYVKAMNKYNDGYIDKALVLCEKSISLNNTNAAALNLKGILYYIKGDLEKAKQAWNINYKRNNDKVSIKYLNDSVRDKEKLKLYVNALEAIRKFDISGALKLLQQCSKSHFNFINVNNYISNCYIKQGEYDKALQYIDEVIRVDKKNTRAIANKDIIIEFGNIKREINYKKNFIVTTSIILILIIVLIAKNNIYKVNDFSKFSINILKKTQSKAALINNKDLQEIKDVEDIKEAKNLVKQENIKFPKQKLDKSIKDNNMEQIVGYVNEWKDVELGMNDNLLIVKGEDIIKSNGITFFYDKGMSYINDKNFTEAKKYFLYALPYSEGNYLQEHIIYMLAVSYKSVSDFENSVKYYELSLKQFPSGSYAQEVLYNLITITKEVNIKKSKGYAQQLVKQYPNSLYNNSIVKDVLEK